MPTLLCTAKASYKKDLGCLELTDTHLQWIQDGKKTPAVRVANSEASSLFCSKEGANFVRLKLGLGGNDAGLNFTFTSPQAYAEREMFKKELTAIVARNRESPIKPPITPGAATATVHPQTPASNAPTPKVSDSARPAALSRAASVASDRRNSPVIAGNDPASDFRLRKKVLLGNPDLAALHRDLVISGQITEAEFWDGREHLLLAQAAAETQRKGKPGRLVDPRPETVEGGEIKIIITPQLVHDIFDEYPVVAKAYNENVPDPLSEGEFWQRYFQSKLFNAHRASIRSSATQHVVKDDPIFDKYLEKDDDELEPRRQRNEKVDIFVDLAATFEDHGETGNEKDITMQAGRQKGALPLIRKFNEHSERLLNSALGEIPPAKRQRRDPEETFSQITLDDLQDAETSAGITLEMLDRTKYFEGRMTTTGEASRKKLDAKTAILEARNNLSDWATNLGQVKLERKSGDTALLSMSQNVDARLEVRSKKNNIPDGLFRQMTTCQTAANEFLRQYWTSMYPPITELTAIAVVTPAQRQAKANKMITYLAKTPEKVNAIVMAAQHHKIDPAPIEAAMKPLLNAVDRALAFHRTRKPARA